MPTKYEYPRSIQEAANLLDVTVPGWAEKVDISKLSMGDCDKCILGQIFMGQADAPNVTYEFGMQKLFDLNPWQVNHSYYTDDIFGSRADIQSWVKEIDKRQMKSLPDVGQELANLVALTSLGYKKQVYNSSDRVAFFADIETLIAKWGRTAC